MEATQSKIHERREERRKLLKTSSPAYFEDLRLSSTNVTRINNLDFIDYKDEDKELAFCHIVAFLPLSSHTLTFERTAFRTGLNGILSILMAIKHLNTGNGTIVKEVEGLDKKCNIRFTSEYVDTEYQESRAVDELFNILKRKPGSDQLPCSFLGSARTAVSMPMSIITGIEGYPQISHFSTGSQLDDKSQYRMFGRVIPSDDGTALPVIQFIREVLHAKHFGVIHVDDSYGYGFMTSLRKVSNELAPEMLMQSIDMPFHNPSSEDIKLAIEVLATTQYRVFFGIIGQKFYNEVMIEAYNQKIAGPGFTWIFADSLSPDAIRGREFPRGSPLAIASLGALRLAATSAVPPGYDRFEKAWYGLNNKEDIEYIETKIPNFYSESQEPLVPLEELFDTASLIGASFLYDATIATGLGACKLSEENKYFNGLQHYQSILSTSFMGSSGNLTLDNVTGTRVPSSATFELTNFQLEESNNDNVIFKMEKVKLFQNGKWVHQSPIIFSDGTRRIPLSIIAPEVDYNYIGTASRTTGFAACALILLASTFFASWTHHNRDSKVVIVSNPAYLHCICCGTFILGCTIMTISIDDEIGSQRACDVACIATTWLLPCGFGIAFSALLSKTWKLSNFAYNSALGITQIRTKDVIKPMYSIMLFNVLILTLWTIISPRYWVRKVTSEDSFGQPISSIGHCESGKDILFSISLFLINIGVMSLALYQAYTSRNVKTQMEETKYIVMAICSFMLVVTLGFPIALIVADMPKAVYFVEISLIFVACTALILFIFWPKLRLHKEVLCGHARIDSIEEELQCHTKNTSFIGSNSYTAGSARFVNSFTSSLRLTSLSSLNLRTSNISTNFRKSIKASASDNEEFETET